MTSSSWFRIPTLSILLLEFLLRDFLLFRNPIFDSVLFSTLRTAVYSQKDLHYRVSSHSLFSLYPTYFERLKIYQVFSHTFYTYFICFFLSKMKKVSDIEASHFFVVSLKTRLFYYWSNFLPTYLGMSDFYHTTKIINQELTMAFASVLTKIKSHS